MKRFSKITTTQLARICGVSQGTVDRALHDRGEISPATRERILAVAREYDYVPHLKNGTDSRAILIGVVLFDLYNEFFSKLAMNLVSEAKALGYSVIFQFTEKDLQNERAALEYFDYIGVDGILLFSAGSDSEEYKNYLHSLKKPLVLIGNRMFDLPYIGIDDHRAMYDLTVKMLAATHGPLVYYAPPLGRLLHSKNAQRLRLDGFLEAVQEAGREYRIATEEGALGDCGGIVCATDHYALKVLRHLHFPPALAIAGFDNIALLDHIRARVLTVEYPTDRIAQECLHYILGSRYTAQIPHHLVYHAG